MQKLCFLLVSLLTSVCFATTNTEGFFNPGDLAHFPLSSVEKSVFEIEIAPEMHGTAFSISNDVMVTNAHNVTQCLRDHGYVDAGYDGSDGPLDCKSLALLLPDSSKAKGIKLLGSNSRHDNGGWDFAIIKLPGLNAIPINLSKSGAVVGESAYILGFPGATYRGRVAINEKIENFVTLFEEIFEAQSKIDSIDANKRTSEEIFQFFLLDGFAKLQPHTTWSEFLSGSLLGRSWNPLLAWKNESSEEYYENLVRHIDLFKKDAFILLSMVEKGSYSANVGYPDADGSLKVSKAKIYRDAETGVKILRGDSTPGSSGSLVVNEAGVAIGILFQIRGLDADSNELCSLDAIMTDFESINFKYCPAMGLAIVSSDIILKKLADWGFKLQ